MTKEKNIYKKILSSCIVLSMVLTGFATMFIIGGPVEPVKAVDSISTTPPSLRIYGEHDAIYPTHSYIGQNHLYSKDFIYPDETTPFDPGVIEKDSITFNPGWIGHEYGMTSDIGEKVFLRSFYEPGYLHGIDSKMSEWYNESIYENTLEEVNHPYAPFDAIVTETTYMATKPLLSGRNPIMVNEGTRLWLPYASNNDGIPGMDAADLLYLEDIVLPRQTDLESGPDYPLDQPAVAVEKEFFLYLDPGSDQTDTAEFMDHRLKYTQWEDVPHPDHDQMEVEITYTGNPAEVYDVFEKIGKKGQTHTISETCYYQKFYFDRENFMYENVPSYGEPGCRWYVKVMYANENYMRVRLGRYLVEGETFYVNGVRYDIPAIYIGRSNEDCMFKYITLQTPYPKCDTVWHSYTDLNVHDWSHVPSQYLYNLPPEVSMWVLPPFNEAYKMIDDIGLDQDKYISRCVPAAGILLDGPMDGKYESLDMKYIDEYYEERFDSTLAERLNTVETNEYWQWYNVFTKPYNYTEFILPERETATDSYYTMDPHSAGYSKADGNEYLVTTSFLAPNSEVDDNRDGECKTYDEHEIYDRSHMISNIQAIDPPSLDPRVVFEFDALETKDLYVNEYGVDGASVRIYGEDTSDGAFYPTHSWAGTNDRYYRDETDPFNPGVIEKDSITFNPAYIGHSYGMTSDPAEKVFLRAFYEPGYYHDVDSLMSKWYDLKSTPLNNLHEVNHPYDPFDAVILETTYMMTHGLLEERGPVAVGKNSRIWLPYASMDDQTPGMDYAENLVWLHDIGGNYDPTEKDHCLTDGMIAVEQEFILHLNPTSGETDTATFMDHEITFMGYEDNPSIPDFDNIDIKVKYKGNMVGADSLEEIKSQIWEIKEGKKNFHFDRANNMYKGDQPGARWYVRIEYSDNTYMRIRLGRYLYAGETFYVDGVRYDIPAIYVTDDDKFKYITFQTPYPKCDTIWHSNLNLNVHDWSHVPTQYLANLPEGQNIWVLPPFDRNHQLIDDIGLLKDYSKKTEWCIPNAGLLLDGPLNNGEDAGLYGPLEFYYIEEWYEERFSSSLAERLNTVETKEYWQWYNVFTKPYHYTEFYLPDQETTNDAYYTLDPWTKEYSFTEADGNEYLITSSWYAPNCERPSLCLDCCRPYDTHDIVDVRSRAPRMAFEHDGKDGTGIYINHVEQSNVDDPVLSYTPKTYDFGRICLDQTGAGSTSFDIWNSGEGTLSYSLSEDCNWITSITPDSGSSTGEYDSITVNVDTTGLSVGMYDCDVTIASNGGSGTFTIYVQIIDCSSTDTTIELTDANIPECGYGYSDLIFDNVQNLGAIQMTISYDKDKILSTSYVTYPAIDLIVTPLPDEGKINIAWFAMSSSSVKNFDNPTTVLTIEFEAVASPPDSTPLNLAGDIYTFDSQPIAYTPIPGTAYIDGCNPLVEGDFDGSGSTNILDALHLAQQINLPTAQQEFNGCHPNVDCISTSHPLDLNILDALYLAQFLTGATGYELYKDGCPKWLS